MNLFAKPNFSSTPPHLTKNPPKVTSNNHSPVLNFTVLMAHTPKRRCDFYDLHKELVPYAEAWSWQNEIANERKALIEKDEDFADSLIILQHHPVYTLGAGSSEEFLNFDKKNSPIDLYRTERGGEVTYHGPGQHS